MGVLEKKLTPPVEVENIWAKLNTELNMAPANKIKLRFIYCLFVIP
jgi:hypothetical protein